MVYRAKKKEIKRNKKKISEFAEQVIDLRRVTRVMAGGKRFSFRATIVIGDQKGRVGVGIGKGLDVEGAINKARAQAKNNMIKIKIENNTIAHKVEAKFSAARVLVKPASEGHGLMAGGSPRVVLRMAGVQNATSKCLSNTTNKLTNAFATMEALKKLKTR